MRTKLIKPFIFSKRLIKPTEKKRGEEFKKKKEEGEWVL